MRYLEILKISGTIYLNNSAIVSNNSGSIIGTTSTPTTIKGSSISLNNGDIIDENTISKLSNEKDSVVCFMGCAYVDSLIDGYKELIK